MTARTGLCPERELLLHALADGELDAANALAVEEHLRSCAECKTAYEDIVRQKARLKSDDLRFKAPAGLRASVLASIAKEAQSAPEARILKLPSRTAPSPETRRRRFSFGTASAAFSAMALAASLILFVSSWNPSRDVDGELVSAHVRSLLVSHLTDVASSDQHTVKPWFLGKLDFAPPVIDLAQKDFPLIGGRLDYIGGREVAALIYRRHGHAINLFIAPAGKMDAPSKTLDGYHILSWSDGGFTFAAVSDLNLAELRDFRRAWEEALR